jgi:hypothetical protein
MKPAPNKNLLFNPLFIIGLPVLLINDHYLKWMFHNWATGKLSDFAGYTANSSSDDHQYCSIQDKNSIESVIVADTLCFCIYGHFTTTHPLFY